MQPFCLSSVEAWVTNSSLSKADFWLGLATKTAWGHMQWKLIPFSNYPWGWAKCVFQKVMFALSFPFTLVYTLVQLPNERLVNPDLQGQLLPSHCLSASDLSDSACMAVTL